MDQLIAGVKKFQTEVFPTRKVLFNELATGQDPDTLFITCADSRLDPIMLTQTIPGELFICRNAGNIIPPHRSSTGGMTASLEYAVSVLGVKDIIICGHSDCGAMKGALDVDSLEDLPHVQDWLGHTRGALAATQARCKCSNAEMTDGEELRMLTEENILQQLQHLRTHPAVAAKLATKDISIHGWLYDIGTGEVFCADEISREFKPLI